MEVSADEGVSVGLGASVELRLVVNVDGSFEDAELEDSDVEDAGVEVVGVEVVEDNDAAVEDTQVEDVSGEDAEVNVGVVDVRDSVTVTVSVSVTVFVNVGVVLDDAEDEEDSVVVEEAKLVEPGLEVPEHPVPEVELDIELDIELDTEPVGLKVSDELVRTGADVERFPVGHGTDTVTTTEVDGAPLTVPVSLPYGQSGSIDWTGQSHLQSISVTYHCTSESAERTTTHSSAAALQMTPHIAHPKAHSFGTYYPCTVPCRRSRCHGRECPAYEVGGTS